MHHENEFGSDRPDDQPFHIADRLLHLVSQQPDACVVIFGSPEGGCGAYGRLGVDTWNSIEVRFFGWPRLVPGDELEEVEAVEALRRSGFRFDGTDWVWTRAYDPRLVPVAAHASQRVLAESWSIRAGCSGDSFLTLRLLDTSEVLAVAAGTLCAWCVGDCTERWGHDETER